MSIGQILVRTFKNGTKVFSREVIENGVKGTRTTAVARDGSLIADRFKTLSSKSIVGGKMNVTTKHYYGEHALGEAFTQGRYDISARVYDTKGLNEVIKLHSTPTYLEKYGTWHGRISQVSGKHPNDLQDLSTGFTCKKGEFTDITDYVGITKLPTIATINPEKQSLLKTLMEKLNFMKKI